MNDAQDSTPTNTTTPSAAAARYDGPAAVLAVLAQPPFRGLADTASTESGTRYLLRGRHNGLTEGTSSTNTVSSHPESFEYFDLPLPSTTMLASANTGHRATQEEEGEEAETRTRRVAIQVEPYHRSAAGKALDEHTLRTPLALEKSMHFLVEHYLRAPHTPLVFTDPFKIWGYLWDRFRGIRTTWIPQLPPCGSDGEGYVEADTNTPGASSPVSMNSSKAHELVPLSPQVLRREGRHRVRWLEFTVAALAVGAAYLCRTTAGCRRFVTEKKNFLESMSQCFTDLAVMYRQERRYRNAEYVSLLLLLYGLRQESKAEDRALFCVFTSQYINGIATLCPELPAASVNLSQVYKELEKQPAMLATQPVRIALDLLHCWATRNWFRFFYLCRTGKLTPVQRAVLFQSFTYARFRAVLDLVLPNRFVYTKLRMRHDIRLGELAELLLMDETHCEEFVRAMGLAGSLDRGRRVLRLSDAKSEGFITAEEIEAHCADKQKLFFPTAPSFFGFRVWREAFARFPHTDFFQHGNAVGNMKEEQPEDDVHRDEVKEDEEDDAESEQPSASHTTHSAASEGEQDEQGDSHDDNYNMNTGDEDEEEEGAAAVGGDEVMDEVEDEGDAYYNYRETSLGGEQSDASNNEDEEAEAEGEDHNNDDIDTVPQHEDAPHSIHLTGDDIEGEDRLLRLPGCPINLMEILEPYCPAYEGEVRQLVLCDVAEALFDQIPAHRAAMLRVASQRKHTSAAEAEEKEEQGRGHSVNKNDEVAESEAGGAGVTSASDSESRLTSSSLFSDDEHDRMTSAAASAEPHSEEEHDEPPAHEGGKEEEEEGNGEAATWSAAMSAARALTSTLAHDPLYQEALRRRQDKLTGTTPPSKQQQEQEDEAVKVKAEEEEEQQTAHDRSEEEESADEEEEQHIASQDTPPCPAEQTLRHTGTGAVTITAALSEHPSPALQPTAHTTNTIVVTRSPIVESPLSTPHLPTPLSHRVQPTQGNTGVAATAAIAAHPWHVIQHREEEGESAVEDVQPLSDTHDEEREEDDDDEEWEEEEQQQKQTKTAMTMTWDEAPSPTLPADFTRKAQPTQQQEGHTQTSTMKRGAKHNPEHVDLTESLPTESSSSSSSSSSEGVKYAAEEGNGKDEEEDEEQQTRISSLSTTSDTETASQTSHPHERHAKTNMRSSASSKETSLSRASEHQQQEEEKAIQHTKEKDEAPQPHVIPHAPLRDPLRSPSPVSSLSAPSVTNALPAREDQKEEGKEGDVGVHEPATREKDTQSTQRGKELYIASRRRRSHGAWAAEARQGCFRSLREPSTETYKRARNTYKEEGEREGRRDGVYGAATQHSFAADEDDDSGLLFALAEEHLQAVWRVLASYAGTDNNINTSSVYTMCELPASAQGRRRAQEALRFALLNADMTEADCGAWMAALGEAARKERKSASKDSNSAQKSFRVMSSAAESMAAVLYRRARLARRLCCGFTLTRISLAEAIVRRCAEQRRTSWPASCFAGANVMHTLQSCMDKTVHELRKQGALEGEEDAYATADWQRTAVRVGQHIGQCFAQAQLDMLHRQDKTVHTHGAPTADSQQVLVEDEQGRLISLFVSREARRGHYSIQAAQTMRAEVVEVVPQHGSEFAGKPGDTAWLLLLLQRRLMQLRAAFVFIRHNNKSSSSHSIQNNNVVSLEERAAHVFEYDVMQALAPNTNDVSETERPVPIAVRHLVHKAPQARPTSRVNETFTTCVTLYSCPASALPQLSRTLPQHRDRMSFAVSAQADTIHAYSNNKHNTQKEEGNGSAVSFPCMTTLACITLDETTTAAAAGEREGSALSAASRQTLRALIAQCVQSRKEQDGMTALRVTGVLLFVRVQDDLYDEDEDEASDESNYVAEQQRIVEQTFWDMWHTVKNEIGLDDSSSNEAVAAAGVGEGQKPTSTHNKAARTTSSSAANVRTHRNIPNASSSGSSRSAGRLTRGLWRGHRLLHRPEKLQRMEQSEQAAWYNAKAEDEANTSEEQEDVVNSNCTERDDDEDAPVLVVMPVRRGCLASCVEAGLRAVLDAYLAQIAAL